jgi:hypothetical protein
MKYLLFMFSMLTAAASSAFAGDAADVDFFEAKVRPLLIDHCYKCHSAEAKKTKGGLSLDTRDGLLAGGEHGPAIVAGKPDQSLLIKAVRYGDEDRQMPPKERLSAAQVTTLEQWVRMGAPDPRVKAAASPATRRENHWALQPIRAAAPPVVKDANWPAGEIDRFILAELEKKDLHPSPQATKRELLRRVTFDLTGLPPTPEEIAAFLKDDSPQAYERVVDRLLASPRYGERWARHWLDLVRFGESHGYEQNHLRDRAWPYRDYVIRAFNEDKPYTQFVAEQLAADVVAPGDPAAQAATGFLVAGVHDTVGNNAEAAKRQQRADDLDDIVSTTGAAFLGLTVGCAKCHDHKFDPIPQADYYALSAVFAGVRHEERLLPASMTGEQHQLAKELKQGLTVLEARIAAIEKTAMQAPQQKDKSRTRPPVNPQRNVEAFEPVAAKFVRFLVLATNDGAQPCLDEIEIFALNGAENLAQASKGAKATASSLLPGHKIHQVEHLNDGQYGNDHSWISNERGKGWAQIELPREQKISKVIWGRDNSERPKYADRLPVRYQLFISTDGEHWQQVASGDDRELPSADRAAAIEARLSPMQREQLAATRAEVAKVKEQLAALAGGKAYIGNFTTPDTIYLLHRGDVMQRGDVVPPAGLSQIPGFAADLKIDAAAPEGERRAALAKWICDLRNPLTARVIVNRIWQHHFGRGLVNTPSDFGANGEAPSHPALLDWLADDFMKHGWTMKRLHRQIVLSRTYQQSGQPDDAALKAGMATDAGNRLLWRMPLRRLEAEAVRDSILAVSGSLDLSPAATSGPGFRLFKYRVVNIALYDALPEQSPETWRRAVFQQTARNIHDDLLAAFDEPENAQRTPRREVTVNALQALTMLHSPFVVRQSELLAERVKREAGQEIHAQIDRSFILTLGRKPTDEERQLAKKIVEEDGLSACCRALFNTNEFLTF